MSRPEQRYRVDFQIFLNWLDSRGTQRRAPGRCVDLSASGARVETREAIELRTNLLVMSEEFGRMGNATIRYCRREGMKYIIGIQFSTAFSLSDPVRKRMLDVVLQKSSREKATKTDIPASEIHPEISNENS